MSSFIVHHDTINSIINYLSQNFEFFDNLTLRHAENLDVLGQRLFQLNADAVADRYTTSPEEITFHWVPMTKVPPTHVYQNLSCFLYQCSEGDIPERSLFKELHGLHDALAHYVAAEHPDVKKVEWR